jgi:hypothetical protein
MLARKNADRAGKRCLFFMGVGRMVPLAEVQIPRVGAVERVS